MRFERSFHGPSIMPQRRYTCPTPIPKTMARKREAVLKLDNDKQMPYHLPFLIFKGNIISILLSLILDGVGVNNIITDSNHIFVPPQFRKGRGEKEKPFLKFEQREQMPYRPAFSPLDGEI